jgi:hypothetical protein
MNADEDRSLTELLLKHEQQLMDTVFRKDRDRVSALLAEEFREFGSSGRVWTRSAILELLASEAPQPAPRVEDFAIQFLGPEAVLATYRAVRAHSSGVPQASLRSSLWIRSKHGWQMVFHQGTRIEPGLPALSSQCSD